MTRAPEPSDLLLPKGQEQEHLTGYELRRWGRTGRFASNVETGPAFTVRLSELLTLSEPWTWVCNLSVTPLPLTVKLPGPLLLGLGGRWVIAPAFTDRRPTGSLVNQQAHVRSQKSILDERRRRSSWLSAFTA